MVTNDGPGSTLLPIGHYLGTVYTGGESTALRQVRVGAVFHDLDDGQFAAWVAAHGWPEALRDGAPPRRADVEEHLRTNGVNDARQRIEELLDRQLLVELEPDAAGAIDFAKSYRVVPIMLGLGGSTDEPGMFGIGFLNQPVVEVSHPIYDLWQWSAMDDSLWAACENAADVARRAGATDSEFIDAARLLTGFLGSIHALLLPNAAYLDVDFRLQWPWKATTEAGSTD